MSINDVLPVFEPPLMMLRAPLLKDRTRTRLCLNGMVLWVAPSWRHQASDRRCGRRAVLT